MNWLLRVCVLLGVLSACVPLSVYAQEEPPEPSEAGYEFFSGSVEDLPAARIVVNRAVLGKPPEIRTFIISSDTKIEGQLRVGARVTVGFKASDEPEPVAVRIIVRSQNQRR